MKISYFGVIFACVSGVNFALGYGTFAAIFAVLALIFALCFDQEDYTDDE